MQNAQPFVSGEVPRPIARAMRRLIRRVRGVILLRGLSAVVATAVGSILLVMAVDAGFILFSETFRWALTLFVLGVTAGVAVWFLILPLARTITLTGIARAVEQRHPELQERLSSAIELLTSRDIPEVRGSETLIRALAEEATHDAARVRPRTEIPLRSARPFLLSALGVLAVLGALWGLFPNLTPRLLKRAIAPFMNLPNISADMLTVTPGDATLPEGERLEIQVEVASKAVKRCTLRRRMPGGTEQSEYMTSLPPSDDGYPRFTMTLPPAAETFRYRVHAGDAVSRFYNVTVVPPPVVQQIDARYAYPEYTRLEPETRTDIPGDIKAVAGTAVTVTASVNQPIRQARLRINGRIAEKTPVEILTGTDGATRCRFQVTLTPRMRGRWALRMQDAHGFKNTSAPHAIEALRDKPPTVEILNPEEEKLRLKPSDHLPLDYAMTDDYGLGKAEFLVATDARKRARLDVTLPEPGREGADGRTATGESRLALSDLPLEGAREFTIRLRAADNRPKELRGPGVDTSRTITVEIDRSAESYAMQRIEAEKERLREGLEKVIDELEQTKRDSAPVKRDTAAQEQLQEKVAERVDRMRDHLGQAEAEVGDMTQQAAEGAFPGMKPGLQELGQEVSSAQDQAGQVKLADTPPERAQAAANADRHVDQALTKARELADQLEQMADVASLAQALSDLADGQAQLADQRAAQAEPDADWQQAQEQMAGDIGEFVRDIPAALQAQLDQDRQAATDLAAQARQLQQEQAGLIPDTQQLARLGELDRALSDLASEQAALAGEAAREPVAADQAGPMNQAAQDIRAANLAEAVRRQRAAEQALGQRAQAPQPAGEQAPGQPHAGQPQAGQPDAAGQQPQAGDSQGGQPPQGQQAGQQPQGGQEAGQQTGGQQQTGQPQAAAGQEAGEQTGRQGGSQQAKAPQQAGGQQGGQPAGTPRSPQDAQRAGELAGRQADIRQRTEDLLAQRNQLAQALADNRMARLQAAQAQVAREATELAEHVAPAGAQPAQMGEQAAHDAQAAARHLPGDIAAAADSATSAAGQLADLAHALQPQAGAPAQPGQQTAGQQPGQQAGAQESGQQAGGQPSGQEAGAQPSGQEAGAQQGGQQPSGQQPGGQESGGPSSGGQQASGQPAGGQPAEGQPQAGQPAAGQPTAAQSPALGQQADGLARRQEALAAEMRAMARQTPAEAIAAAQQGLAQQTGALEQAAGALAQRTAAVAPQVAGSAEQATGALQAAQASQGQAQESLAGGEPQSAPAAQQSAAESLGQAAEALSNLGQALAQAAQGMPTPSAADAAVGQPLAQGHTAASQAAASQSAGQAAQAAQSLAQAASQAAAMANGMGAQPGRARGRQQGLAQGYQANSERGTGPRKASLTAAKLEALGIKLSDWARLPGELRNEILQAADQGAPEEYRALIKRYFQKVARKGGTVAEEDQ